MKTDSKKLILKNSSVGLIQLICTAILTLICIPIFISKLGLDSYGVFAVISVVGNLSVFTNLGLNQSLIVYLAKQGKCKESDYDIVVTAIMLILFALIVGITVIFFKSFIVEEILSIPSNQLVVSEILLTYLVIANGVLLIGQTFTSIIDATQKIYISNICQFVYSLLYWGGMIVIISFGGGLKYLGIWVLVVAIIWFILVFVNSYHIWGPLNIDGLSKKFTMVVKKQLGYGSKIYLSGLVGFLFEPLSKILLSSFVGVQIVGVFEIALKIRGQISSILNKGFYPIFPYIASTESGPKLDELINDFSKKIQLIIIPIVLAVIFMMPYLLKIWLGTDNIEQITLFVIVLSVSYLVFSPVVLPIYVYFTAKNKAHINVLAQLSSVVINVVVFIITYQTYGVYAILFSNSLAYFASFLVLKYAQFKYTRMGINTSYLLKLMSLFISIIVPCALVQYFDIFKNFQIIVYPLLIVVLFVGIVRKMRLITLDDIKRYFSTIPQLERQLINWFISN